MTLVRACAQPGCPNLCTGGRCPEHAKSNDSSIIRRGRGIYQSPRWQALRRQVFKEQGYRCALPGCFRIATDLDHIRSIGSPGCEDPFDRANLQGLCHEDHSSKTIGEVIHLKASNTAGTRRPGSAGIQNHE